MQTVIALMGAGGKMGCRLTDNLKDHSDFEMLYVEVSEAGKAQSKIFQPDWKQNVLTLEAIRQQVRDITHQN